MIVYIFYLLLFPLATFFISNEKTLGIAFVYAETPIVTIFPECGSTFDHRISLIANGFHPNGNVHWALINSNGEVDSFGYFETDMSGNFEEIIFAEKMEPDTYMLRLFDDMDNDFIKDFEGSEVRLNYNIPCDNAIF